MRVVVDAMGGDHAPAEVVRGAHQAATDLGIAVTLVGDEGQVRAVLDELPKGGDIHVVHAPDVIGTGESPIRALKAKPNSSLARALREVQSGRGEALVSAGNTGALMSGSRLEFGMMEGLRRPALGAVVPVFEGHPYLLLDAGANVDARPEDLLQWAVVGSIYCEKVLGRPEPRVGLLNIGREENKGNDLTRAAHGLLKGAPLQFVGNVEPRDLPFGVADVVVADGFVGNAILKLSEGFGLGVFGFLKREMTASLWTKVGSLFLAPRIRRSTRVFDYAEYGGAPLFGPRVPVIKCHGASKAKAIRNGVRVGHEFASRGTIDRMQSLLATCTGEAGA